MNTRRMAGLTLVELMVAITVGLVMMNVVLQIYLGSRQSYLTQQAVSNIQENGRLAMEFLSRDLRMVGYMGCHTSSGKELNELPGAESGDRWLGEDAEVLELYIPDGDEMPISGADGSDIIVDTLGANKLKKDDKMLLTNCNGAAITVATGKPQVVGGEIKVPVDSVENATDGSALVPLKKVRYYIDRGRSGRPGLFRERDGQNLELVGDVPSMRFDYQDANGDGTVDTVQIRLLLQSAEANVLPEVQTGLEFNGEPIAPDILDEKRLLQEFTTTVALRNRMGN